MMMDEHNYFYLRGSRDLGVDVSTSIVKREILDETCDFIFGDDDDE